MTTKKGRRRRLKHANDGASSSSNDSELELDLAQPTAATGRQEREATTTLGALVDSVSPSPQRNRRTRQLRAAPPSTGQRRRLRQRAGGGGGSSSSDGEEDDEIEALVASASQPLTTQSAVSQPTAAPAPAPAAASADVISILDSGDDSSSAASDKKPKRKRIRRGGEASQGSAPASPAPQPAYAAAAASLLQTPPSAASSREGGGRRWRPTPPSSGRSTEQAVLQRTRERVRGGRLKELEEEEEEYGEDADEEDEMDSFIVPEDDEEAEDEGEVRCVCGVEARDAEVLWVQCTNEECECWVHGPCFGIRREKDVPRHFRCHVCDPDGKTRRGIILPSSSSAAAGAPAQGAINKRKRARKPKDVESPVELYARLERPLGAWGQYGGGDADEDEEDAALGRLVGRAVERFGLPELARPRGIYKRSGFTVLMAAAAAGRVAAVRALLDGEAAASESAAGGEPLALARDAEKRTAAHHALAAVEASEAAVQAILERLLAGCGGEADRRRLLVGRDKSRRNLLHAAAARGGEDSAAASAPVAVRGGVMRFLIAELGTEDAAALAAQDDKTGRPPLAVACAEGGAAECEALLGVTSPQVVVVAEVDPEKGVTALMEAVDRGFGEVARRMIMMGGHDLVREKDRREESALHRACMAGDAATVAAILEECPELVHEPNKDQTYPLHFAALGGAEACVVKLLEHGARPDVKDEAGWSPLLYADFQGEQGCVLALLAVQPESQLAILGDLLSGPMRGDPKVVKLLRSLTAVPSFSRFINAFVREHMELLNSSLAFLLEGEDGRQLLDLRTKAEWLERQLQAVRQHALVEGLDHEVAAAHPYYTDSEDEDYYEAIAASRAQYRPNLSLGRDGCWPALLRAAAGSRLTPSPAAFFRRNVMLQLLHSPGIGPGVEREVLELLAQGMVGAQGHQAGAILTLAPDNDSYLPRLPVTKEVERGFYLLGVLAAHVLLYMPKHLAVNLNSVFLKLVLRREVTLSDLQDLDHDFHRSLEELLQNNGAENLCLSFTQPAPGGGDEVELCPGGRDKDVTDANKQEYARLVVRHRTHGTYGRAAEAMRRGVCDVLLDPPGRLLKLYTAPELGTLIAGIHDVEPADWEAHATYGDYTPESGPVQWFWKVVRRLSKEERALLLKFSSGSSRLPVDGFAGLHPRFLIQKVAYHPLRPLPTSSTCFNMLKLPDYPDEASLEKYVLLAIRFGAEGFAFT